MNERVCDFSETVQAVMRCSRLLIKNPPDAKAAWYAIEPYIECCEFTHHRTLSPTRQLTTRQMILASAGDCCYHLKDPGQAAEYYRQAFMLEGKFLVADMYARVVVENDLEDHYSFASQCVDTARAAWRKTWLPIRMLSYAIWFVWYVVPHPRIWKQYREGLRYRDELQRRALQI